MHFKPPIRIILAVSARDKPDTISALQGDIPHSRKRPEQYGEKDLVLWRQMVAGESLVDFLTAQDLMVKVVLHG